MNVYRISHYDGSITYALTGYSLENLVRALKETKPVWLTQEQPQRHSDKVTLAILNWNWVAGVEA